jgi:chromosome segregation ATPase
MAKRAGPGAIGSPNTIQRHINTWREKSRPIDPPLQSPQLPQQVAADIARALSGAALAGQEQSEKRLLQVQAELEELAASGESFESQIDELTRGLVERTSERDAIGGQLKEQSAEVERLTTALARESRASEALRLELAKSVVQMEGSTARAADAFEELRALRLQSMMSTNELKAETELRSITERRADVAEARLQITQQALVNAEIQLTAFHAMARDSADLAKRAAAAEATVGELRGLVGVLQQLLPGGPGPASTTRHLGVESGCDADSDDEPDRMRPRTSS